VFDGKTLENLQNHPVFGPRVSTWIANHRTDWKKMKAELRMIQNRARRQRHWLTHFEKGCSERLACAKTLVTYATFYTWKTHDPDFRDKYKALRELHAMTLVEKAREFASDVDNVTDRWNLIRAEAEDYDGKKEKATVTVNFNSDIEFTPQTVAQPAVDTTADPG
jgi:hypothetical protein